MAAFNSGTRTIEFWIRLADHSGIEMLLTRFVDTANFFMIQHRDNGDELDGFLVQAKTSGNETLQIAFGSTQEINDTNWHHIAMIQLNADWGIYLDGTQVLHIVGTSGAMAFAVPLSYGYRKNGGGDFWTNGNYAHARWQNANYFGASPNSTPDDTIIPPVGPYTADGGGGWTHIINGVANASIAKINGVAKVSIAEVNQT